MPGVLVIEALVQLSAVLAHDQGLALDLSGIAGARFKRQVSPGDQLLLEARMGPVAAGKGTFDVQASVDGELAAEARAARGICAIPGPALTAAGNRHGQRPSDRARRFRRACG